MTRTRQVTAGWNNTQTRNGAQYSAYADTYFGVWPQFYGTIAAGGMPITLTFTWQPSGTSDVPPPNALVEIDANVFFNGDSGSCSDGLGDAEVDAPNTSGTFPA